MMKRIVNVISVTVGIVGVRLLVIFLCLFLCLAALVWDFVFPRQYCTSDLNDYGKYIGNYDNDSAQTLIAEFFPEKIEADFANVKYSYRAQKGDTYAFEAYLEFQIEDEEKFESYLSQNIGDNSVDFQYDSDFKEYVISNELQLWSVKGEEKDIHIKDAKIRKILYSEKNHQIIYVALGVYDGGAVKTDFLCEYFNRFGIDPVRYEKELLKS